MNSFETENKPVQKEAKSKHPEPEELEGKIVGFEYLDFDRGDEVKHGGAKRAVLFTRISDGNIREHFQISFKFQITGSITFCSI